MHKKLFIFDLDGTLVDAYPAIIASFNFAMLEFGYPAQSDRVIKKAVGRGDENLLKPFVRRNDLARAIKVYRTHHAKALLKKVRIMPHARPLLSCLKNKGMKIAIASNRPTKYTHLILKALGLDKIFNKVLCADRLKFGKPNPLILNKITRQLGVPKEESLYIGDMAIDVEAGKRAGIETIAVVTGSSSAAELKKAKPTFLFKDLERLKKACLSYPICWQRPRKS